jgi:mono/diheme cytochrome c family protein
MKRTCYFSLCLLAGILFVATLALPVQAQTPTQTPTPTKETVQTSPFPNDVTAVFKNSCMACHGAGGRALTLTVLNLSKWDEYDADKKAKKAAAICDVVTKGAMPPASYQRSTPTAVLTQAQKELICKWSQTQSKPK